MKLFRDQIKYFYKKSIQIELSLFFFLMNYVFNLSINI